MTASATRPSDGRLPSSFRDPSGYLFRHHGTLYRSIGPRYRDHYDRLMDSGLYTELADRGLMVEHEEIEPPIPVADTYRTLRPQPVPLVSYPYEWCFGQLKAAALATLEIQDLALAHDMILKDASAYNIQFLDGRPVLIDTLSFEIYREGQPWVAYGQFCRHFLAPLLLVSHRDHRLARLSRLHIDGVPLTLASSLLPLRSRLSPSIYAHIHLHARYEGTFADRAAAGRDRKVSRQGLRGIVDNLRSVIQGLGFEPGPEGWVGYEQDNTYSERATAEKEEFVTSALQELTPKTVWDLGANTGRFSRLCSRQGVLTVAADGDFGAVERAYRRATEDKDPLLLPLVIDLTNPSPDLGWHHRERDSLLHRGPADLVLALALTHHLAIGNNVPLDQIVSFFADAGRALVVEFVPKEDPQVQRLLASREDVFPHYDRESFETALGQRFDIRHGHRLPDSERVLYLAVLRA